MNSFEINNQKMTSNRELSELYQLLNQNTTIEDLPDGDFYEVEIDGKQYIVNENDILKIDGKEYDISKLLGECK